MIYLKWCFVYHPLQPVHRGVEIDIEGGGCGHE
jgi:hypothetical protein